MMSYIYKHGLCGKKIHLLKSLCLLKSSEVLCEMFLLVFLVLAFFGEGVSQRLCQVCECGERVVDCSGRNIRGFQGRDFATMGGFENVLLRETKVNQRYIGCRYLGGSRYVDLTGSSVDCSKIKLECGVRQCSSHTRV